MEIIKIEKYNDLKKIYNKKEFIVNIAESDIKQKRRIIDFLCGYVQPNGIIKKISFNEFIIKK